MKRDGFIHHQICYMLYKLLENIFCELPELGDSIIYSCLRCVVSTQFKAYPFAKALFSALNRVLLIN